MKCSIFIATSADGYIATQDGSIDWLYTAGNPEIEMGPVEMGFTDFIASVDCMIMGRKCMDMIASMNLSREQWPYGDIPVFVLSNSISEAPLNLRDKVEIYSGPIPDLLERLNNKGYQHAYIDGGATITAFLNLKLINQMTITKVPVLLGEGIPLFGKINSNIKLEESKAKAFPNDFIQIQYRVKYQEST